MLAVLGLGANLGERLVSLRVAAERIAELGTIRARSTVYETDPVGGPPQPRYLNAALALDTALEPEELMRALLAIEAAMGRVRSEKNGPRTLDLDILWIEGAALATADLTVPHPRLTERTFALVPMLEVVPDASDPTTERPYAERMMDRSTLHAVDKL